MKGESIWKFDRELAKVEERSLNYDLCGGAESTAEAILSFGNELPEKELFD